MKITELIMIGIAMSMAYPLGADQADTPGNEQPQESAYLKKHEKNLERMQAARRLDTEQTHQAQVVYSKDTAEMIGHAGQQSQNVLDLKSLETQVTAGQEQETLAYRAYKESAGIYGPDDPKSATARASWRESQETQNVLLENRLILKDNIHHGGRQVHNDKVLLSIQKRTMDSNARYRAMDDRDIEKEEKTIANNRSAMTQVVRSSEPAGSPR